MRRTAVVFALALVACGGLLGIDEDAPQSPPIDAGAADAGDAATSTTGESDTGATTYCATVDAAYCEDFDRGALAASWTEWPTDGGTVALAALGRSLPNALTLSGDTGDTTWPEAWHTVLPLSPTHVVFDVSARREAAVGKGTAWLQVTWGNGNERNGVAWDLSPGQLSVYEIEGWNTTQTTLSSNAAARAGIDDGAWHRVHFDVDWGAKSATVAIDDDTANALPLQLQHIFQAKEVVVELGAHAFVDGSGARVFFDDLVVTTP